MTDTTSDVVETPVSDAPASLPDATDADAPSPTAGSEADSSPAAENPGDQPAKPVKELQDRVHKLTRNWRETERERDYWREQALKSQPPPATAPEPPAEPAAQPRPTREQFGYDDEKYEAALADYLRAEARREATEALKAEREREAASKAEAEARARIDGFKKSAPDFDDVVQGIGRELSGHLGVTLSALEQGPAVAYHLGQRPELAAQLAQLPPMVAAVELGRIAARLDAAKASPPAPALPKAPPPPPKLDAADGAPPVRTTDPSGDTLSDDEWVRLERKRLARKRK